MRISEACKVLGISPTDTPEDARKAYHKLARAEHPDKSEDPKATERFQQIQNAFTCLQVADESGRWGVDDDEPDYDDDDYYDGEEGYNDDCYDMNPEFLAEVLFAREFFGGAFPDISRFSRAGATSAEAFREFTQQCHSQFNRNCESCHREAENYARSEGRRRQAEVEAERRQQRAAQAKEEERRAARREAKRQLDEANARAQQEAEATARLKAAQDRFDSKSEVLRRRGNKAYESSKFATAATLYSAALHAMAPKRDARLLSNRSACYCKLDRYEDALRDAEECRAISSGWDKAHARVGMALSGLGRHDEAERAFLSAAECARDDADSRSATQTHAHGPQTHTPQTHKAKPQAQVKEQQGAPSHQSHAHRSQSQHSHDGGGAEATWRQLARQQREAALEAAAREKARKEEAAAAAARKREEAKRKEAAAAVRRNEVEIELGEALTSGSEVILTRCLAAAARVG
eukprot:6180025-Pleurochrysis_carterae.AAC.1